MLDASNPYSDAITFGVTEVIVSQSLVAEFFKEKGKNVKKWINEINKNLKECSVKYKTHGYGHGSYIIFYIEFDDVDCETEDW